MERTNDQLYQVLREYLFTRQGYDAELHKILVSYKRHPMALYKVYVELPRRLSVKCEQTGIEFNQIDHVVRIRDKDLYVTVSVLEFRSVVTKFCDMMMPIYPLGTAVSLKKEYLTKILKNQKIEQTTFVIVQRFNYFKDIPTFLPLGGVVYPLGIMKEKDILYFTPELVENVEQVGYETEFEQEYELLMKKDLILEKGYSSILFASDAVKKKLESRIRGQKHGG